MGVISHVQFAPDTALAVGQSVTKRLRLLWLLVHNGRKTFIQWHRMLKVSIAQTVYSAAPIAGRAPPKTVLWSRSLPEKGGRQRAIDTDRLPGSRRTIYMYALRSFARLGPRESSADGAATAVSLARSGCSYSQLNLVCISGSGGCRHFCCRCCMQ